MPMSSGACIVTRKVTGQVSVSPSRCAVPTETTSTLCTSAAAVSSAAKSPAYRLDPTVAVMGRPVSSAPAAPASLPVRRPEATACSTVRSTCACAVNVKAEKSTSFSERTRTGTVKSK